MKRKLLVCAVSAIVSGNVFAADYYEMVYLDQTEIRSGDKIESDTSGINVGSSSSNRLDLGQGSIVVKVRNPGNSSDSYGIDFKGDSLGHNLGVGTIIDVDARGNSGSTAGLNISYMNELITAKELVINLNNNDSDNSFGAGVNLLNSKLDLGNNSHINMTRDILNDFESSSLTALYLQHSASLNATDLTIDGKMNNGFNIDLNSNVDVGNNTKIKGVKTTAISLKNNSSFIAGNNLEIEAVGDGNYNKPVISLQYGNNSINLGENAKIKTKSDEAKVIFLGKGLLDSSINKLEAKNLHIDSQGEAAIAVFVEQGEVKITGAKISMHSGTALYADSTGGGLSAIELENADIKITNPNRDPVNTYAGPAIIASDSTTRINLKNVNVDFIANEDISALASGYGAEINAHNVTLSGQLKARGANTIGQSSSINFTGETTIRVHRDSVALLAEDESNITLNGIAHISGDILAKNNSTINLNTNAGSEIFGDMNYSRNSQVSWKGEGSTWIPKHRAEINNLELTNGSKVDFTKNPDYAEVTIQNLLGSTEFSFKVDFDGGWKADKVNVLNTSSGNHTVSLQNNGSANTDGTEKVTIIETPDGGANFTAAGEYEFGGYLYGIRKENNDPASHNFEVYSTGQKTNIADASVSSTVVGNYLINMAEQEHLTQRMSLLRADNSQYGGWVRTYGGKFKSFQSRQLKGFDMDYSGFQLGVDGQISQTADSAWYLGGALHYTTSDQNYRAGSGKQKSYGATLYATYLTEDDWYTDLYLKYSHYKNKLEIRDSLNEKVKGTGTSNGVTASAEIGKRYTLNQNFYVEPNVQLAVGRISSSTIKNSNGLRVDLDKQNSTLARVGSNFGYSTVLAGQPVNLYTKLNYAHEFEAEQKYKLNGNKERLKFSGSWLEFGVGANALINNNHSVFMEVNGSTGNRFDKYDFNLGYKYSF